MGRAIDMENDIQKLKVRVDSFIIMFFVITNIKIYSNFCCFNTLKSKNMPIKKKINKNKIEFLILPVT